MEPASQSKHSTSIVVPARKSRPVAWNDIAADDKQQWLMVEKNDGLKEDGLSGVWIATLRVQLMIPRSTFHSIVCGQNAVGMEPHNGLSM